MVLIRLVLTGASYLMHAWYMHTHTPIYPPTHTHTSTPRVHTHTHTHTHTAHKHPHTHTHTHTHTTQNHTITTVRHLYQLLFYLLHTHDHVSRCDWVQAPDACNVETMYSVELDEIAATSFSRLAHTVLQ